MRVLGIPGSLLTRIDGDVFFVSLGTRFVRPGQLYSTTAVAGWAGRFGELDFLGVTLLPS